MRILLTSGKISISSTTISFSTSSGTPPLVPLCYARYKRKYKIIYQQELFDLSFQISDEMNLMIIDKSETPVDHQYEAAEQEHAEVPFEDGDRTQSRLPSTRSVSSVTISSHTRPSILRRLDSPFTISTRSVNHGNHTSIPPANEVQQDLNQTFTIVSMEILMKRINQESEGRLKNHITKSMNGLTKNTCISTSKQLISILSELDSIYWDFFSEIPTKSMNEILQGGQRLISRYGTVPASGMTVDVKSKE